MVGVKHTAYMAMPSTGLGNFNAKWMGIPSAYYEGKSSFGGSRGGACRDVTTGFGNEYRLKIVNAPEHGGKADMTSRISFTYNLCRDLQADATITTKLRYPQGSETKCWA